MHRGEEASAKPAGSGLPVQVEQETMRSEYSKAIELIHSVRNDSLATDGVHHWSLSASRISADFFCSAEHHKNGWHGFLADAAGHGLASAIFALHTPALFRESVLQGMSLAAIYDRINRFLCNQKISGYYMCGILVRVWDREIEIINAGMPDAMLLDTCGKLTERFFSLSLPFGIEQNTFGASPVRHRLSRGESAALLLYSDGLTDIGVQSGQTLGMDGIQACEGDNPVEVYERLIGKVKSSEYAVHDDVSLVLIPVPFCNTTSLGQTDHAASAGTAPIPPGEEAVRSLTVDLESALRIIESLDRGLVLTDAEQRILYVNAAFTQATGYTLDESIGQTPRLLSSGRHDAAFYKSLWQSLLDTGTWKGEIWNRRKDGSLYLEWLDIRRLCDETGVTTNYLAVFTVIEQFHEREARLQFLALHDPLTGLANRTLLADRGDQALHRADRADRSLVVLFIDLDRFSTVNDSMGHEVGDQVLREAAQRFASVLRDVDTLARFGGDEFVCLLPDIARRDDAALVATKLLAMLDKPIEVDGHFFKVGASIGISAYPSDGRIFDDLIVLADRAMLQAKQAGGNLYRFYSASMSVIINRQLEVEARLAAAIKNQELELHYQPKLDLKTHRIIGAEALVRWRDPQRGLVPPGEFIPIAEKSDLIAAIGHWVLHEACQAVARWTDVLTEDFHVAINISPIQFQRCNLAEEIAKAFLAYGNAPQHLQIEVTESMLIRDVELVGSTLESIQQQGVSIALDDFGTGYSNLGSLGSLPFDTFKLDQGFVRNIDRDATKRSIAQAIWHLGTSLGKKIIAEGIETKGECAQLRLLGYITGQGYLFGKPMAEAEFRRYLQSRISPDCNLCRDITAHQHGPCC